jgi:uncharacterized protein
VKTETRNLTTSFRAEKRGDKQFVVSGYAAVFNSPADIGGKFIETIQPGAFRTALAAKQNVRVLWNHEASKPLGSTRAGTATVKEDNHGLFFSCQLDPTITWHADVYRAIERGDVNGASYGFSVSDDGQKWEQRGGKTYRILTNIAHLLDVSPVVYPAGSETSISARAAGADGKALDEYHRRRLQEIEAEILRDAPGFRITGDGRVVAMSESEVAARVDARNRIRAAEQATEIVRDAAREEIETTKRSLGL